MLPVNLSGELKRSLTNADRQHIPDLDIKVQLNDLECSISQKSLKLLFAILNENLNEGTPPPAPPSTGQVPPRRNWDEDLRSLAAGSIKRLSIPSFASPGTSKQANLAARQISMPPAIREETSSVDSSDEHPPKSANNLTDRVNIKLFVDLKRIKLIIVELTSNKEAAAVDPVEVRDSASGGALVDISDDANDDGGGKKELTIRRISNNAYKIVDFSHLEIQDIDFDYVKHDDLSWLAVFKMKEMRLNDIRPDSNLAVKEMFIPLSKDSFFIVVDYKVDKSQNAQLDFTLSHLKINLCLPYILKLYQMLMDAVSPPNSSPKSPQQQQKPTTSGKHRESTAALEIVVVPPASSGGGGGQSQPQQTLSVRGRIQLPEVVLFAEPEKLNCKTLIMNTELVLNFESRAGKTQLEIGLTDLSLRLGENITSGCETSSAASGAARRRGIPFLNPCSAHVSMRQDDPSKPAQYKAHIESLYLNMTPTMYEVVMGVVNTINKTGTEQVSNTFSLLSLLFIYLFLILLKS